MSTPTSAPVVSAVKPKKPVKLAPVPEQQYVTKKEFDAITDVLASIVDKLDTIGKSTATPAVAKQEKDVAEARSDQAPINPLWEEKAREIIGESVDHCEVYYPKSGGQIFTVVIKDEFSNAPKEYLERMKSDRRSKEIGNEGIGGVEIWCKLIRANLKRTANK